MVEAEHRTETIRSGDVDLFARAFGEPGAPGATPILILHGSNYFDSYDWIGPILQLKASVLPVSQTTANASSFSRERVSGLR